MHEGKTISRRFFFQQTGSVFAAIGGSLALPACLNDANAPVSAGADAGSSPVAAAPGAAPSDASSTPPPLAQQGVSAEQMLDWFVRNERLYTLANPGQHAMTMGRPEGHDPKYLNGQLYVGAAPDATHAMTEEHHIGVIGLRDQGTGLIVYASFLDYRVDTLALRAIAPAMLNLPAGTTLMPLEWCDDHNLWGGTPGAI